MWYLLACWLNQARHLISIYGETEPTAFLAWSAAEAEREISDFKGVPECIIIVCEPKQKTKQTLGTLQLLQNVNQNFSFKGKEKG